MEIVVGAIEVGGHHGNKVGAVLQVVALAHLKTCNLGNGVRLVGVLQGTSEKGVLHHRLRGLLGIDAGAAEEEKLLHTVGICLTDNVALDLHVHHDEVGTVEAVGHDASHESGCQHNGIGLLFIEELLDSVLVGQIHLLNGLANQIIVSTFLEVFPNGGANQSGVACHINLCILV